jgi:hypothetical protein
MPRKKKGSHQFQRPQPVFPRDETIEALLRDPWGVLMDAESHVLLAPFEPDERRAILDEVERKQWAAREAERLPILLERLRTWPAYAWADIFCEMPALEKQLTPAQKVKWVEFVRGNRARLRARGVKLDHDAEFDTAPHPRSADAPRAARLSLVAKS